MKETIYTIPINEAFDQNDFCPFCAMHDRLEKEAVRYTLGAAMMEPDFRIITNELGFCKNHMKELNAMSKALPLSLVLSSHLTQIQSIMSVNLKDKKKSIFKKSNTAVTDYTDKISQLAATCAICSKINHEFSDYISCFVYMLHHEKGFADKVLKSEGFCMEHFALIANEAMNKLSASDYEKYFIPIAELQRQRVIKFKKNIDEFSESFDYRNAGKKLTVPRDILIKTGYLLNGTFLPKEKNLDDV